MDYPFILIPVNRLDRAKARLASLLQPEERANLAFATLSTVWQAARHLTSTVAILTADPRIPDLLGSEATILEESPSERALNGQITAAIFGLVAEGKLAEDGHLLILHADLPLATSASIDALAQAFPGPMSAAIVPSGDGGTNAMLVAPPLRFALQYGENSAALHAAAAREAGMLVVWHESPPLALDLDTPADVAALLRHPDAASTAAGRALARMDIAGRLGLPQ